MKKNLLIFTLTLLYIVVFQNNIYAQENFSTKGTDFWFGFMKNIQETQTTELSVYISSETDATGTVSIPLNGWSEDFTVSANSYTQVFIPSELGTCSGSGNIENKGIHVTSTEPISVFALNYESGSFDASLIYPTKQLGNKYYILSYPTQEFFEIPAEFLIVGIKDNTKIKIIPFKNTADGHYAHVPYYVTLDQGQTYQVQADLYELDFDDTPDLTGSYITTTGNNGNCEGFAVFAGAVCAIVPVGWWCAGCDHLYEQVPPTASWGKNFVTVPLKTRKGDLFRILAAQDSTTVTINNGTPETVNLDARKFYEIEKMLEPSYITSNKPILVAQYSHGSSCDNIDGDPFMVYISPLEQSFKSATFNTLNSTFILKHYLNIIAKTTDVPNITLNGISVSDSFKILSTNNEYSYAQLNINENNYTLVSNAGTVAYIYGYGNFVSYGCSAGTNLMNLNNNGNFDIVYQNDTTNYKNFSTLVDMGKKINFIAEFNENIAYYKWEFGDGTSVEGQLGSHIYNYSGTYTVNMIYQLVGACNPDTISAVINVGGLYSNTPNTIYTGVKITNIYPTPANDYVKIMLGNVLTSSNLELKLYSITGAIILEKTISQAQNNAIVLPIHNYSTGIYILKITNGTNSAFAKIVKK